MRVGSLFSGIGGLDLGLARAGHEHVFFCESDPWRREVLAYHWPGVPIYEDVAAVANGVNGERRGTSRLRREGRDGSRGDGGINLLCGGFPCQDVSVAGRRAGLAGERSGLFHEFARIAESLRPGWILVENVPGLLSSNGGRDFGVVLGTLADIGYGVAWRILDSRYFGVPQRRRRVFILGAYAPDDTRAAAERCGEILAVGTRCERHPSSRGEARADVAGALGASIGAGRGHDGNPFDRGGRSSLSGLGSGGADDNDAQAERLVVAHPLTTSNQRLGDTSQETFVAQAMNLRGREGGAMPELDDVASLRGAEGGSSRSYVAAPLSHGSNPNSNMAGRCREDDENLISFDAEFSNQGNPDSLAHLTRKLRRAVSTSTAVRRLTPTECERLQALPDGWTDFGPDSRRYAALGDAVTASVAEWIGRRLA